VCYEADADTAVTPAVIFLTRVWDPSESVSHVAEERRKLNEMRVGVVRTLRSRLGRRFVGGIERTPYAQAHYPDCVVDVGALKTDYVALMKRHLIGVATTGLHGSTGWKLAEYIAAARCIVSEPVPPESCPGFVSGTHYLEFESPEQCADACEKLLDDPRLAAQMRRHNAAYYRSELAPEAMLSKRLTQLLKT
jgi:hypothetical protein